MKLATQKEIGKSLLAWEKLGMVPTLDSEYVDLFIAVIQSERVTVDEWDAAVLKVSKRSTYKIKPADVLQYVDEIRAKSYVNPCEGWRECLDEYGTPVLAAPDRILNGRLLPPGERNQNPDHTPALPSTTLTADARRERVERMANQFGAECAARFVEMLQAGGFDVRREIEIVNKARENERAAAAAEQLARAQVAAELEARRTNQEPQQ